MRTITRRLSAILVACGLALTSAAFPAASAAQTAKAPVRRRPATPAPAPKPKTVQEAAQLTCPSPLGAGVKTKLSFCDVLTGRDVKEGILVTLPPHRGLLTLRFDLHNRHTYSEDEMKSNRGYASYTASVGALTMDNTLLARGVVAGEFRTADDLVDRISGGAGPGGVKAVAPTGSQPIAIQIPADVTEISILGEKLTVIRSDGVPATYSSPGRPIAIISNATVEYTPAPAPVRKKR